MFIAGYAGWLVYDTFLIVSFSGWPVYDPNPLRPNPNSKKPVSGSCRVCGLGWTLTPLSSSASAAYKEGSKPWVFLEEFEVSLRYVSILGLGLNLGLLWNCTTNWQEIKDEVWLCISSRNPSSPLKESWASKIHYLVMPHEIIRLHHFRCIFSFYTLST